jgi:hypothetical protein
LAAQLLTENMYDQENEDGSVESEDRIPIESDEDEYVDKYVDDDPIDDDEDDDEEENIDNITSEPDEEYDDDDPEDENLDHQTPDPNEGEDEYSDGCEYKITRFFDSQFACFTLLKSEYSIFIVRIQNSILLF